MKLSYGSESEQADPLDKVPFYKDSPGAGDAVQNISQVGTMTAAIICSQNMILAFLHVATYTRTYVHAPT